MCPAGKVAADAASSGPVHHASARAWRSAVSCPVGLDPSVSAAAIAGHVQSKQTNMTRARCPGLADRLCANQLFAVSLIELGVARLSWASLVQVGASFIKVRA